MKNKKIIIGVLCLALVFMGIGFAAFTTSLNLSGTATSSGTFDVKITNVVLDSTKTTSGVTDNTEIPGNNYAVTTQYLSAEFSEPGQYITWTLTVTNRGTIAAKFTVEANPQVDTDGPYKLSCNAAEGTSLAPSASTTFQCEMSFDKNHELTSQEYASLTKGVDVTMEVSVTAVQSSNYVAPTPAVQLMVLKSYNNGTYTDVNQPVTTYGVSNLVNGDLLGYDTEQFYVYDTSGNSIRMLSRYLINVGPNRNDELTVGLQSSEIGQTLNSSGVSTNHIIPGTNTEYGSIPFSADPYWWDNENDTLYENYPVETSGYAFVYDSNSYIYPYISGQNGYVNTLRSMGLNVTGGTVLSIDDLTIACGSSVISAFSVQSICPSYIYETSYWLGSNSYSNYFFSVSSDANIYDTGFITGGTFAGIRPLITVSVS